MAFDQIQCYFFANNFRTLIGWELNMYCSDTNDRCVAERNDKIKIVEAVLFDFSAAFDFFDHHLLLKKQMCYGFT
jgi:hypothetical protein